MVQEIPRFELSINWKPQGLVAADPMEETEKSVVRDFCWYFWRIIFMNNKGYNIFLYIYIIYIRAVILVYLYLYWIHNVDIGNILITIHSEWK